MRLKIKPLSVNECWQGKRFKTPAYKSYEKLVLLSLPKQNDFKAPYSIQITFGFSTPLSDIDNPVKPFLDILQKKYGINDKDVFELHLKKELVKKGSEFIEYNFGLMS